MAFHSNRNDGIVGQHHVNRASLVLNISVDELLGLLNRTLHAGQENEFWIGDGFTEVNCEAPSHYPNVDDFSAALILQRRAARQTLQSCVDQWIDSGKCSDGKENAMKRSEETCPDVVEQATIFWRSSQFERLPGGVGGRAIPPRDTFDSAMWKARRCIAAVLDNPDLRHRIAKCRFERCRRPYFLLNNPAKKVYEHGLFCRPQHNNRAASARNSQRYRQGLNHRLAKKAAKFVLGRKLPPAWDCDFKSKVAKYLDDAVTMNWVTRHEADIQEMVRELRKNN